MDVAGWLLIYPEASGSVEISSTSLAGIKLTPN